MTDLIRRRLRITGQVQGVFFRASTAQIARREGVTGWVQNMSDGSVHAEVQGRLDAVEVVQQFLCEGPPQANVADVRSDDIDPVDGETGFDTR